MRKHDGALVHPSSQQATVMHYSMAVREHCAQGLHDLFVRRRVNVVQAGVTISMGSRLQQTRLVGA
jgi:hypothetical protein